jgi:hypothetical protein
MRIIMCMFARISSFSWRFPGNPYVSEVKQYGAAIEIWLSFSLRRVCELGLRVYPGFVSFLGNF